MNRSLCYKSFSVSPKNIHKLDYFNVISYSILQFYKANQIEYYCVPNKPMEIINLIHFSSPHQNLKSVITHDALNRGHHPRACIDAY